MSTVISKFISWFSNQVSSKYPINFNFSASHKGQQSIFVFPQTFSTIGHLILYSVACG